MRTVKELIFAEYPATIRVLPTLAVNPPNEILLLELQGKGLHRQKK